MDKEILKSKLLNEKKVSYIGEIDFAGKRYVKGLNMQKTGVEYEYYEIIEENLIQVSDLNLIKAIKSIYEVDSGEIIY